MIKSFPNIDKCVSKSKYLQLLSIALHWSEMHLMLQTLQCFQDYYILESIVFKQFVLATVNDLGYWYVPSTPLPNILWNPTSGILALQLYRLSQNIICRGPDYRYLKFTVQTIVHGTFILMDLLGNKLCSLIPESKLSREIKQAHNLCRSCVK